jgi:acetolactate synthase small subunit
MGCIFVLRIAIDSEAKTKAMITKIIEFKNYTEYNQWESTIDKHKASDISMRMDGNKPYIVCFDSKIIESAKKFGATIEDNEGAKNLRRLFKEKAALIDQYAEYFSLKGKDQMAQIIAFGNGESDDFPYSRNAGDGMEWGVSDDSWLSYYADEIANTAAMFHANVADVKKEIAIFENKKTTPKP